MFKGGKTHYPIPKNKLGVCTHNISSCFSFTVNVLQEPGTYLYALVVITELHKSNYRC